MQPQIGDVYVYRVDVKWIPTFDKKSYLTQSE